MLWFLALVQWRWTWRVIGVDREDHQCVCVCVRLWLTHVSVWGRQAALTDDHRSLDWWVRGTLVRVGSVAFDIQSFGDNVVGMSDDFRIYWGSFYGLQEIDIQTWMFFCRGASQDCLHLRWTLENCSKGSFPFQKLGRKTRKLKLECDIADWMKMFVRHVYQRLFGVKRCWYQ